MSEDKGLEVKRFVSWSLNFYSFTQKKKRKKEEREKMWLNIFNEKRKQKFIPEVETVILNENLFLLGNTPFVTHNLT